MKMDLLLYVSGANEMTVFGVRILASYESISISTSMFKVDNFAWPKLLNF